MSNPVSIASPAGVEAEIRRLGLRSRTAIHHGEARPGALRWAHHEAIVWDPVTRRQGRAWSDRSAGGALEGALAAFHRTAER